MITLKRDDYDGKKRKAVIHINIYGWCTDHYLKKGTAIKWKEHGGTFSSSKHSINFPTAMLSAINFISTEIPDCHYN